MTRDQAISVIEQTVDALRDGRMLKTQSLPVIIQALMMSKQALTDCTKTQRAEDQAVRFATLFEQSQKRDRTIIDPLDRLERAVERIEKHIAKSVPVFLDKVVPEPLSRAGDAWTPAEDQQLRDEFVQKLTIKQMQETHKRTRGAITARLERLELVPTKKLSQEELEAFQNEADTLVSEITI